MKKYLVLFVAIANLLISCKDDAVEPVKECENCLTFTDPRGVKRTFNVYSKELSDNTTYRDSSGNTYSNTVLKLYFSESPTSIIGLTFYTNRPYEFKRNYTASGQVDLLPGGMLSGAYNKALVVFWDGGNSSNFSYLALRSDVHVRTYSYSENVNDQHILQGTMDLVFEHSDSTRSIPSFGVNKAEIKDAQINIKF